MGLAYAEISASNPRDGARQAMQVRAGVDTGALHLCLPEHVALQLGLTGGEEREVTFADGKRTLVPRVGPVRVSYGGRDCFVGALVLGDAALPGAISMEDMDLIVHPATHQPAVNPQSPNIPSALAKGLRGGNP
jgi:clan AA aspartic protease